MCARKILAVIWLLGGSAIAFYSLNLFLLLLLIPRSPFDGSLPILATVFAVVIIAAFVEAVLWMRAPFVAQKTRKPVWIAVALLSFCWFVIALGVRDHSHGTWGAGALVIAALWSLTFHRHDQAPESQNS